ncbi:MAG: pyridoxal phosphate-dependent aminotransferase family protein [Bacteroidota bacterium]|nr:pyridoxal phosphate-dependent aminotransferase family protein [Bacteroidota bacterium]
MNDDFLDKKLLERKQANALRSLIINENKIDFCSNDYLGIVKSHFIENSISENLSHGSTGSRLLSGNYKLIEETEKMVADFHDAQAGLIFNSGYDANLGVLSSVPQKNDAIIYDQLSHASLRDGIRLSFATAFSFLHNNLEDLEKKLAAVKNSSQNIFIVTESVFSMDGDFAPLKEINILCEKYNAALIVDEAHATGVVGEKGEGLVQHLHLQDKCFARIHTFGKACGSHGAIVLGSNKLKKYLINFARTFIYSTSLPQSAVDAIRISYEIFPALKNERNHIHQLISRFKQTRPVYKILQGDTPIQIVVIPGNEEVKKMAAILQQNHFDIRAILYPTVPKGQERLRIVLHAFNRFEEIDEVIKILNPADL